MKQAKRFFSVVLLVFVFVQPSYARRYFDSWCARWTAPDPMQRKYPSWSPYCYALDNPIKNIDPNGDTVVVNVHRILESKVVTQGLVYVTSTETDKTFSDYSIEPKSNDAKPKIKAGTYKAWQQYHSDEHGDYDPARLHLINAVSESGTAMPGAEVHGGLTIDNSTGCTLVGLKTAANGDEIKSGNSTKALQKINDIIDADGGPVYVRYVDEDKIQAARIQGLETIPVSTETPDLPNQ